MTAGVGDVDSLDSTDDFGSDYMEKLNTPPWNGRDVELQTQSTSISQFHVNIFQKAKELVHIQIRHRSYDLLDLTQDKVEEVAQDFDWPTEPHFLTALNHSSRREFALADPIRHGTEIAQCKHFWRNVGKAIEHGYKDTKKAAKKTYKAAKKGIDFIGKGVEKGAKIVADVAEKIFDAVVDAGEAIFDAIVDTGKTVGKAVEKGTKETIHFVKEHKKEVLIGVAIAAAACGLYIILEEALRTAAALKAAEMAAATAAAGVASQGRNNGTSKRREDADGSGDSLDNDNPLAFGITSPQPDTSWMTKDPGDSSPFNTSKTPSTSFDQHSGPWVAGSPHQKIPDELMASHGDRVSPSTFSASLPQPTASAHFKTAFNAVLETLRQATISPSGNTPQFAAVAPFQNLPAFHGTPGQSENTFGQSGFVDCLENLGKTALNVLPAAPVTDTGAFQRPIGSLESLGLGKFYTDFLETIEDEADEIKTKFPSPAEFLQIISGVTGLFLRPTEESHQYEAGENNLLSTQLGLINTQALLENGSATSPEETISNLRSVLNLLTEFLQKTAGLSGMPFEPMEESSLIATEGFGLLGRQTGPVSMETTLNNETTKSPEEVKTAWPNRIETFDQNPEKFQTIQPSPLKFSPKLSPLGEPAFIAPMLFEKSEESRYIKIEGSNLPGMQRGFINGMNTSFTEGKGHTECINTLADGASVEWFYNHSNGPAVDLGEIFLLGYSGLSPKSADLISKHLVEFHMENKDNPNAKYLMFTHSMGNIIMKNVLLKLPKEIRDRVIVVAIAPAVIIPEGLCYDSFHYASKKDIVHRGEDLTTYFGAGFVDEEVRTNMLQQLNENKERLILLDPHSSVTGIGIDHGFQSPTFAPIIKWHNEDYDQHKGQYKK